MQSRNKMEERRRKFEPFHLLIIMGSVRLLTHKMEFRVVTMMQKQY